jgi:hypothetical protein
MLCEHRASGRTCRRARVVSEPLSTYQRWTSSHVELFRDAGEDIRYVPRCELSSIALPDSGDFYVFDDELALFLHYSGNGTNEGSWSPMTSRRCGPAGTLRSGLGPRLEFREYSPE